MNGASPRYGLKQSMARLINVVETDEGTGFQARPRNPYGIRCKTNSPAPSREKARTNPGFSDTMAASAVTALPAHP